MTLTTTDRIALARLAKRHETVIRTLCEEQPVSTPSVLRDYREEHAIIERLLQQPEPTGALD